MLSAQKAEIFQQQGGKRVSTPAVDPREVNKHNNKQISSLCFLKDFVFFAFFIKVANVMQTKK